MPILAWLGGLGLPSVCLSPLLLKVSSGPCKQNRAENSLSSSSQSCFYRYAGFPDSVVLAKCKTGRGWASVLKTQLSNGRRSSLEKSRYKYLDIKTEMKNMGIKAEHRQAGAEELLGPTVQQLQLYTNYLLSIFVQHTHNLPYYDDLKSFLLWSSPSMKSCYKDSILIFPRNLFFKSPVKDLQCKTNIKTPTTSIWGTGEQIRSCQKTFLNGVNPLGND